MDKLQTLALFLSATAPVSTLHPWLQLVFMEKYETKVTYNQGSKVS